MKYYPLHNLDLQVKICRQIIDALPDWFGLVDANEDYVKSAAKYDCFVAEDEGEIIALAQIKFINNDILKEKVGDIHWLGMLPEYHGKGIGSKLINLVFNYCKSKGYKTITVETLDPAVNDAAYLKTYAFYKKFGFETFHHFDYDDVNKMVVMKKRL